jgi:hypothetical protein
MPLRVEFDTSFLPTRRIFANKLDHIATWSKSCYRTISHTRYFVGVVVVIGTVRAHHVHE